MLGSNHPDYAESLQDLGVLSFHFLHLEKAHDLFSRANQIRQMAYGPDHPTTAETLCWLGRAMVDEVDLTLAHEYQRQAVAVAERAHGPDHPAVARALDHFGRMCYEENDFARAERVFVRAIGIRERHGLRRHPEHGEVLMFRARNLDDWTYTAVVWEGRSVDIQPVERAYEEAERLYEELPTGEQLPNFAGGLMNHATIYYTDGYRLRSPEYARSLVARGRRLMEQRGPLPAHPQYINYLLAISQLELYDGDFPAAIARSRELVDYGRNRLGYAFPNQLKLGHLHRITRVARQGTVGEERDAVMESIRELQRYYTLLSDRWGRGQSAVARLGMARNQSDIMSLEIGVVLDHQLPTDVYPHVLEYRGQVGATQTVDRAAFDHPELTPLRDRLRDTRQELTRTLFTLPADPAARPEWMARVHRLSDQKDDLEGEIAFRCRATRPRPSPTVKDVQAALPPGAVLVEYCSYRHRIPPATKKGTFYRQTRLVAFVVHKDGPPICVPLGTMEEIDRRVNAFRQAIVAHQAGRPEARLIDRAAAVAELIWKPVAPHVGPVETLVIAPDGPVCLVPFAILPGTTPGSYLLEDYRISYLLAGREMAELVAAAPPGGTGLLAISGDGHPPGPPTGPPPAHPVLRPWPNLPFARPEAERVVELYGSPDQAVRLSGREATPAGVMRAAAGRRYLHYAGHGFFADPGTFPDLTDGPDGRGGLFSKARTAHPGVLRNLLLLSGLVLAGDGAPVDRLLTAEQVTSLDLRGTELVVLSACETGVGDVTAGEGAMSLQRAFLTAGSRAVVSSLWKVDDAATAVLMDEFYRNLWQKKRSKLDALRDAQLTVLRRPDLVEERARLLRGLDTSAVRPLPAVAAPGGRTDPALWAAFILTGDGR